MGKEEWQEGDTFRWNDETLYVYSNGVWWETEEVKNEVLRMQKEFVAFEDDIVLASFPKVSAHRINTNESLVMTC